MTPKRFLVWMTAVAVVSDSLLHPFYPQYFAAAFDVHDPAHVGLYIAACSLSVLVAFPVWARIARRVPVLHLLIGTQLATFGLCLACSRLTSLPLFWLVSLVMMVFKASYLLIYPYVMSLEEKHDHAGTIGLLAIVVYFGNILSALLAGLVLQWLTPGALFQVMACGDLLQTLLCVAMLGRPAFAARERIEPEALPPLPPRFFARLGLVMFVLYFSADLTEPFFSSYWESLSAHDDKVVSGIVFAIPGIAALCALYASSRRAASGAHAGIVFAIALAISGLWLQASGQVWLVLGGRFIYGWALFAAMVRLDLLLFSVSSRERYALDFSYINLFQGLGVLAGSLAAGSLAKRFGGAMPFMLSAAGFVLGGLLFSLLFRRGPRSDAPAQVSDAASAGRAVV